MIDPDELIRKLLASYVELESPAQRRGLLGHVIEAAFEGLDCRNDKVVAFYRRASLEIAKYVDAGKDGTSKNAYHFVCHFAEATSNFRALANYHNTLVAHGILPDHPILDQRAIAGGIFATCVHDICHDGKTNMIDRDYRPFRLEERSIQQAPRWVTVRTSQEKTWLQNASNIVYGTDPRFAIFVRAWHDKHFEKGPRPGPLPEHLKKLAPVTEKASKKTVLLGALVQDADTAGSLIDRNWFIIFGRRVAAEMHQDPSDEKNSRYFLNEIQHGRSTTFVARLVTDPLFASYGIRPTSGIRVARDHFFSLRGNYLDLPRIGDRDRRSRIAHNPAAHAHHPAFIS
ncbi:MAG TPA: hypothetical protein VMV79_05125 [Alphaproteobacteria bacterium]|nr:hypothetical protein [Alphaproteobacteria bacterium]